MRRKPFGKLLPSAHAVDREYRVIAALGNEGFPVAKAYALCRDDSIIGAAFEQKAQLALELGDQAYVIETGRIVMSGNAKDIANNEEIRKSYLGY